MGFTVFLGNLPAWVTADDIRGWLSAENLVADAIKVIRNPETQESKGFAFIDSPNIEEMNSIIRRFDRAPLEDRLLRANPAQPPKPKGQVGGPPTGRPSSGPSGSSADHYSGGHGSGQSTGRSTAHSSSPQASQSSAPSNAPSGGSQPATGTAPSGQSSPPASTAERPPRRAKREVGPRRDDGSQSAFAEELARAL